MSPSTFLRSLSTKLSSHLSPSSVAPWPPVRSGFAIWLTSELDRLRSCHPNLYATSTWLAQSLDLAIMASQQIATSTIQSSNLDKKVVGRLIEDDIVDLLDACNVIRRRIEEIHAYMGSLDIALHWLEGDHRNTDVALQRASKALESCEAIEKRSPELDSCLSSLRKLGEKIAMKGSCATNNGSDQQLQEVVVGSRAVALLVISMATVALSFRTRRGIPTILQSSKSSSSSSSNNWWGSELSELHREAKEEYEKRRREGVVLEELKVIVSGSQRLRSLLRQGECEVVGEVVSELKSKCREMDEFKVKPLEEKVEGLYRGLIDVRMCLLNVISEA